MRDRDSELLNIPVQQATAESLAAVVARKTAETIWRHFHEPQPTA